MDFLKRIIPDRVHAPMGLGLGLWRRKAAAGGGGGGSPEALTDGDISAATLTDGATSGATLNDRS